jgi:hypothetical protein
MQVMDMKTGGHVPTALLTAMAVTIEDGAAVAAELLLIGLLGGTPRQRPEEPPDQ